MKKMQGRTLFARTSKNFLKINKKIKNKITWCTFKVIIEIYAN